MQKTDRLTKTLLALLVLGVWGLLLRPLVPVTPAEAQSGGRTKWEYVVPDMDGSLNGAIAACNRMGKEGWELAVVSGHAFYFKRPIR